MKLEALKLEQREIFSKLDKFTNFHLVGGTALALQIGHRISVDFDLFSKKDIPKSLIAKVKRVFRGSKIENILNHSEQLICKVDGIKIDFVKYKFPLILGLNKFKKVKIIKIPEIAAMKAYTLNYRGTYKDYIDLYFILKDSHTSLEKIKEISEKKYKNEFNFRLFLEQLIYLKDIKIEKIEFLEEKVDREKIEEFFKKEIRKYKKEIMPADRKGA